MEGLLIGFVPCLTVLNWEKYIITNKEICCVRKIFIEDNIKIKLSPSRHSLFSERCPARQNMKSLQSVLVKRGVWLTQYREQVNIKFLSIITVIYLVMCCWWPVCIIKNFIMNKTFGFFIANAYIHTYIHTYIYWPFVKSCLVGGSDKYHTHTHTHIYIYVYIKLILVYNHRIIWTYLSSPTWWILR